MITREIDIEKLVNWLANNMQMTSRLLYPEPEAYVFLESLLDFISDDLGVGRETVAEIFNRRQEQIEVEQRAARGG